jgi:hypothetical protein
VPRLMWGCCLDAGEELELLSVSLDGVELPWDGAAFQLTPEKDLIIPGSALPKAMAATPFTLETKVKE